MNTSTIKEQSNQTQILTLSNFTLHTALVTPQGDWTTILLSSKQPTTIRDHKDRSNHDSDTDYMQQLT